MSQENKQQTAAPKGHQYPSVSGYFTDKCRRLAELIHFKDLMKAILPSLFKTRHRIAEKTPSFEEAERQWKHIFHAIGQPSMIVDPEHRILAVNQAVVDMTGISAEQLLGKNCSVLFHGQEQPPSQCPLEHIKQSSAFETVEMEIPAWGGIYLVSCTPVMDKDGRLEKIIHIATDVTDRIQAKRELEKSKAMIESVFASSPDAITVMDGDGTILQCNQACAVMHGFSSIQDLVGTNSLLLVSLQDRPTAREHLQKTMANEGQHQKHIHLTLLKQNGDVFPAECSTSVIHDAQGRPEAMVAIVRDISDRVSAEQTLRASEQRYRTLIDTLPHGIQETDASGTILFTNAAHDHIFGYKRGALIGKKIWDLETDNPKSLEQHCLRLLKECPTPKPYISTGQRQDGSHIAVQVDWNYKWDAKGDLLGLISVITDITERQRAVDAVRQQRDLLQSYLDIAGVMFVALNTDGIVTLVNRKTCEILGYEENEILGRDWFSHFLPPKELPSVRHVFNQLIQGQIEIVETYENPVITRTGEKKIVSWHNTLLKDKNGHITGTLSSGLDITERKQALAERVTYQAKLKSLASELTLAEERERRRIAVGVHDDIGQKLALAKLGLQSLGHTIEDTHISDSLNSICKMIDETMMDARSLAFELSNPVLYEIGFEAAVESWLTRQIEEKCGLECHFKKPAKGLKLGESTSIVLFQAVRELLTNVVKHADARRVDVSISRAQDFVTVIVQDNGKGFDVSSLDAHPESQHGLGLFNIRERLEYLSGQLHIQSTPGQGTRITMKVPLTHAVAPPSAGSPQH